MTGSGVRNERDAKARARIDRRTSLVPAPAVIPAPIAYIKVVAVKKLVVGRRPAPPRPRHLVLPRASVGGVGLARRSVRPFADLGDGPVVGDVDLEQIEVLQASASLAGTIKQGMVEDDRRPHRFPIHLAWVGRTKAMIRRDGRGHPYLAARGEILGPAKDERLRKRLPSTFSLIKNESRRIEDDQIPS